MNNWKAWMIATGISVGVLAGFVARPLVTSTNTGVYYTGGLDTAFHPVCRDYAGNTVPCSGTPMKAQWIWAQDWAEVHGGDYIDWGHIQYNTLGHCTTAQIWKVRGTTYCKCVQTGQVLSCPPTPVPKP